MIGVVENLVDPKEYKKKCPSSFVSEKANSSVGGGNRTTKIIPAIKLK